MTDRGQRRFEVSLGPKILGTLLVVLALSASATLTFENRLTRTALQDQARSLLDHDLDVLRAAFVERQSELMRNLRTANQRLELRDVGRPSARTELIQQLGRVRRELALDVLTAVDHDGEAILSLGVPLEARSLVPPRTLAGDVPSRLVRTADGRYAQVALVTVGSSRQPLLLVGGFLFDDATAYQMRSLVGGDVLLVADRQLVGSTLREPFRSLPGGRLPHSPSVVDVAGTETFVDYVPARPRSRRRSWAPSSASPSPSRSRHSTAP